MTSIKEMIDKYPQFEEKIGWIGEHDHQMFERLLRGALRRGIEPQIAVQAVLGLYSQVLEDRRGRQKSL